MVHELHALPKAVAFAASLSVPIPARWGNATDEIPIRSTGEFAVRGLVVDILTDCIRGPVIINSRLAPGAGKRSRKARIAKRGEDRDQSEKTQ